MQRSTTELNANAVNGVLISVVDDDEPFRRAMKTLLEALGYATATFSAAEEFLKSGARPATHCLILDVEMPAMRGPDLQTRLAADGDRTPIIFVTGSPDDRVRTHVLEAGAVDYLLKPFNQQTLMAAVQKALGG